MKPADQINVLSFLGGRLIVSPGPDMSKDDRASWFFMCEHFKRGHADDMLAAAIDVAQLVEAMNAPDTLQRLDAQRIAGARAAKGAGDDQVYCL